MRAAATSLWAALLVATVAACGGDEPASGVETFDESAFEITFEYPAAFDQRDDYGATATAGAEPVEETALVLDDENAIVLSKYALNASVDAGNVDDVKAEVDALASSLAGGALTTEKIELGGLPGFTFETDVAEPANGRSRVALLFAGMTEYTVNCVSTPARRQELEAACERAFETLRRK